MKSPRTLPRLVMKEWPIQKRLNSESRDRDMTQDARTELSMVERMTAAITKANREFTIDRGIEAGCPPCNGRDMFVALAVMKEMREPTSEMQMHRFAVCDLDSTPDDHWRAMIDGALLDHSVPEFT